MKGSNSSYRPAAGTRCLVSGPNCDDDSGYVFFEMTILWRDDTFVLYGTPGFSWPVLNKWEHVIAKPVETTMPEPQFPRAQAFDVPGGTGPSKMTDLLPCPFCGAPGVHVEAALQSEWHRVECSFDGCSAEGPLQPSSEEAIMAWNWRVDNV